MLNCGIVKTYYKEECRSSYCVVFDCKCDELYTTHIKNEYFENNGKKEGIYKEWFYNGTLKIECNYINGMKNGFYKEYDNYDGSLSLECTFIDDKLNGIYKEYYENGILWKEKYYIDGLEKTN